MQTKPPATRFDRNIRRIKDHPVIASVLVIAVAVIGLGELTGALDSILTFLEKRTQAQRADQGETPPLSKPAASSPVPEPRARIEVDQITVNSTCDKEDEARDAELRWQIFIGAEAFDGSETIPVASTHRLSSVYADYKTGSTEVINVRVHMEEMDKGGVAGNADERVLALDLGVLNRNLPSRFELAMWPGPQRNECDVRVGVVVRPIV